jgi:hypothetical protein
MRRHGSFKRFGGLIAILMLAAGITAVSALARAGQPGKSPRSGALHVTKQCFDPPYEGKVGQFCTIRTSNIPAIKPGMKVVYLAAADLDKGMLDSDLALGSGQGTALGHVIVGLTTGSGRVTFTVGTGRFSRFRANAVVSPVQGEAGVFRWDGRYRFGGSDDD